MEGKRRLSQSSPYTSNAKRLKTTEDRYSQWLLRWYPSYAGLSTRRPCLLYSIVEDPGTDGHDTEAIDDVPDRDSGVDLSADDGQPCPEAVRFSAAAAAAVREAAAAGAADADEDNEPMDVDLPEGDAADDGCDYATTNGY